MLHRLLTLARVSNLPTVWSNCLAAWLIAGAEPSWRMLWLLAGASLIYAAGCTLNDAFDARWDAQHRPERLIPSGVLSRRTVWIIGLTEMTAGLALIFAGGVSAWWPPAALAAAILLYDAWHKQSPLSVIVMGACRWLLYLTAAAAAGGDLKPVMILGAVLWLYIIILSLVARGEAKRDRRPPLTDWLLLAVPGSLMAAGMLLNISNRAAALPAALLSWLGIYLLVPDKNAGVGTWVNRLLAAIPVVDLAAVLLWLSVVTWPHFLAFFNPWLPAFPAAVMLCLFFQRRFQAT
jgi:4-hydroxybenzoate polyprenyltransferase